MMLSAHAAVGVASSLLFINDDDTIPSKKAYISAFTVNVFLHGVMDLFPHSHPISPYLDVIVSLLIAALLFLVKKEYRTLILFCYLGSITPDVIDLGIFRVLRLGSLRIFPWHFLSVYNFLNEIFTNSRVNMIFNMVPVLACLGIVFFKRKRLKSILNKVN